MSRIRTVKPEFWTSEQVTNLTRDARLLFIGLWNFCDDAGIHTASARRLRMEVFPADNLIDDDIARLMAELIDNGLVVRYEVSGDGAYWQVTGWHHQRIDQPTFRHPRPDGSIPDGPAKRRQANVRQVFAEQKTNARQVFEERSPPEGKGEEGNGVFPSQEEVLTEEEDF